MIRVAFVGGFWVESDGGEVFIAVGGKEINMLGILGLVEEELA